MAKNDRRNSKKMRRRRAQAGKKRAAANVKASATKARKSGTKVKKLLPSPPPPKAEAPAHVKTVSKTDSEESTEA